MCGQASGAWLQRTCVMLCVEGPSLIQQLMALKFEIMSAQPVGVVPAAAVTAQRGGASIQHPLPNPSFHFSRQKLSAAYAPVLQHVPGLGTREHPFVLTLRAPDLADCAHSSYFWPPLMFFTVDKIFLFGGTCGGTNGWCFAQRPLPTPWQRHIPWPCLW